MRSLFSLSAIFSVLLLASNVHATSQSKSLSGGNSTLGYTATVGFSDAYNSTGTVAYKITPTDTVTANILGNSFNLFSGYESLEFRRDSSVHKVCSLSVARVTVYYDDHTVLSSVNNLSVALVFEPNPPIVKQQLFVGPVPVIVTVNPSLALGVKGTASATPAGCSLSAGVPYVDAAIKASGGVGASVPIGEVSAGVEGTCSLLYSELQPGISMNYNTRAITYGVNWVTKTLNGALNLYAKVILKNPWNWPINMKYTYQLWSWPPAAQVKVPVYNVTTKI